MEVKLQFSVFMLLIQASLAVWQRVTVMKDQVLTLTCPITDAHKSHVEWKNPEGFVMFFNNHKALKDKRYSIIKLSETEFSVSISNVTFKDGGIYRCLHYTHPTTEKKVEVTVIGRPIMSATLHDGKIVTKCTAEANYPPPSISWQFDQGPEFDAHVQVHHEGKKYISVGMIKVRQPKKELSLKCLVRHPALHSQHLLDFINIGQDSKISYGTTTTSSPAAVSFTTGGVSGSSLGSTSVSFTQKFSSDDVKTVTASVPLNHVTSTGSHLSASDNWQTSVSRDSTGESSHTTSEATNTTDWISVSNTTENSTSFNGTGSSDSNMRRGSQGNASLLVLLVTCLIFGLLVVVIFFAIKLRRAHMAWKRENEDSVPSEESSKSKSSQEEKGFPGQRKRALNTAFTQYVNEKPTTITIIAPPESVNKEQILQPQTSTQTSATNDIKETSL